MATKHFHLTIFILLQLCFQGCSCPTRCVCFTPTRVFCSDEDVTLMPRNLSINVKELIIMTTGITQLQPSAFPEGSKLLKLVFLNNLLQNISRMTFNKLLALQELEISGNHRLEMLYMGTLSGLVNLTTLVLNFNNFKVLQFQPFHTLRKLETLELKGNILEDLTDDLFEELGRLRLLDLSLNKISKVRRELFGNLSQLRTLKLDYNRIDMLSNDTFDGVPRLRELNLQGNKIARLPQALFTRLIELEKLNLRGNLIEDLAAASFPPSLVELNLVKNRLAQLPPASFQGLSHLTCLLLSKNQLSVLQEDLLRNLTALQHLDLSDNLIESLPETTFEGLSELEVLHLENNNISRLHSGLFKDQEYLQQLYLSNNTLENIPATLFDSFLDHGLIRLHNNPWTCDCHLLYLHDWLVYGGGVNQLISGMYCRGPSSLRGLELASLKREQLVCEMEKSTSFLGPQQAVQPVPLPPEFSTTTTTGCVVQEANGTISVKCLTHKCPQLKVLTWYPLNGSPKQTITEHRFLNGAQCLNSTIFITF